MLLAALVKCVTRVANAMTTKLRIWSTMLAVTAYAQLVLGAHLRHTKEWMSNSAYQIVAIFHLIVASLIVMEAISLFVMIRQAGTGPRFTNLAWVIAFLVSTQIALGVLTWVVNYGWPWGTEALKNMLPAGWVPDRITAGSFLQTTITTSHVAVGSLILATSGLLSLRSFSLLALRDSTLTNKKTTNESQLMRSLSSSPKLQYGGDA